MVKKLNQIALPSVVIFSLIAASIEPILVKIGLQLGFSLYQMLFFRNLMAWVTAFLFIRNKAWIGLRLILKVVPLAILLFVVNISTLFALQFVSVATVLIVIATTPIFVALVNQRLGREILQKTFWIGFAICFIGVFLSVGAFDGLSSFHLLSFGALILAIACSTTYRVCIEYVSREVAPVQISFYIFSINALLTLLVFPFFMRSICLQTLSIATWIGVAAALANIAFISSIHLLGATRMSVIDMLQRPLVIIAAAMVLSETLTIAQVIGCVLTLLGAYLSRVERVSAIKTDDQKI